MNRKHKYGQRYADVLNKMRPTWLANGLGRFVIGAVGILKGNGLAIWSRVFPNAEIHGFDFMVNNTKGHMESLKSRGGFLTEPPNCTLSISSAMLVKTCVSCKSLLVANGPHYSSMVACTL